MSLILYTGRPRQPRSRSMRIVAHREDLRSTLQMCIWLLENRILRAYGFRSWSVHHPEVNGYYCNVPSTDISQGVAKISGTSPILPSIHLQLERL